MALRSYANAAIFACQDANMRYLSELIMKQGRVSYGQTRLLFALYTSDAPLRVSDLASYLEQSKGAISKASNALVERNLVDRFSPDGDRRTVLLSLTETGRDFCLTMIEEVTEEFIQSQISALAAAGDKRIAPGTKAFEEHVRLFRKSYSDLPRYLDSLALREKRLKGLLGQTMSPGSFHLLIALVTKSGPMSVAALSRHLNADKTAISRNIGELMDGGYVQAQRSEADRRLVELSVTEKGEGFVEGCDYIFDDLLSIGQSYTLREIELVFEACLLLRA